jgi:hypothetical protein
MKWTPQQLREYETRRASSRTKPECAVPHEPVAAPEGKAQNPGRVLLRITSFRRRLIDPDNLCPKYFIDALRYAQVIGDDSAAHITLEVSQIKVKTKTEERTEVEVILSETGNPIVKT